MKKTKARFSTKSKLIIAVVVLSLGIGGTAAGLSMHQAQVRAEQARIAKEKADYEKQQKQVTTAVQLAYDTRKSEDKNKAISFIQKLKKVDQKQPTEKLSQLDSFLKQIKDTENSLSLAEKSKSEKDVSSAQKAIDDEKHKYLTKDKQTHQERLNKLKKAISDEKAKQEKEKQEAEAKAAAEALAAQQAQEVTYNAPVQPNVRVQEQGRGTSSAPAANPNPSTPSGVLLPGAGKWGSPLGQSQEDAQNQINREAAERPFG